MLTTIAENLQKIKKSLPREVALVAVSKTKSVADIKEAYTAGQQIFGENKVQEMVTKYNALPKDIRWHMIGHLQRNKIKYMAHFVDLIHGISDIKTLKEVDKQAQKHNRIIRCLLQLKIAEENTKFGLSFDEVAKILSHEVLSKLKNIKIVGFMGMATFTDNIKQVAQEFSALKIFFDSQKKRSTENIELTILSMGMSGDYKIAIENGSTMVRIGSSIFGARNYIA